MGATRSTKTKAPATLSKDGTAAPESIRPSVYKRRRKTNGVWYVCWYWPDTRTTHTATLATKDAAEAEEFLALWRQKILPSIIAEREHVPAPVAATLSEAAAWYATRYLPMADAARSTIENYMSAVNRFVAFAEGAGVTTLSKVSGALVGDWVTQNGTGRARVRDSQLALRLWLTRYAEAHNIELPKIAWNIPSKKQSRRFRALTPDECRTLLDAFEAERPDVYWPAAWMLATGWRIGDVLDFRWDEIKGDYASGNGFVDREQLKTGDGLAYPITKRMAGILDAQPSAHTGHVFRKWHYSGKGVKPRGEAFSYAGFMQRWDAVVGKLEVKASPRDLRVTFATRKAEAGCPMHILAALMGHRDATMAARYYVRLSADSMREWATK